jgi:hypothetical protein
VLLADVDDHGSVAVLLQLADVLRVDLLDLLLDPANQLCAGRHPSITSKPGRDSILQKV